MAAEDIVTKIIFDDSDAIKGMKNVASATDDARKSVEELNEANANLSGSFKGTNDAQQAEHQAFLARAKVRSAAQKEIDDGVVASGKAAEAAGKKSSDAFLSANAATKVFATGINRVRTALLASGVGAFIALIGSFVSSFLTAENATKAFGLALEGLGIRSKGATALLKRAKEELEGFEGAAKETQKTFDLLFLTADERRIKAIKERLKEINQEFVDINKTTPGTRKEMELLNARIEQLKTETGNLNLEMITLISSSDDYVVTGDKTVETVEKVTVAVKDQTEAVEGLIKKQAEQREARIQSLISEQDRIALANEQANINLEEDGEKRINRQADFDSKVATLAFDNLEARLVAEGISLEEFEKLKTESLKIIELKRQKDLAAIRAKFATPSGGFLVTGEDAKDQGSSTPEDRDKEIRQNARQSARSIRAVSNLVGGVLDGITDLTDQAISENERFIDSLRERRDELQSVLEDELALREQGLANNVTGAQKALDALQAQEEAAQLKQEELEKKRTKQQLLQDQLKFVSQIGLAVASLVASEASKGIIGLVIAAAAIPFLFSLIKGATSQAKSLHEGGPVGTAGTPWRSDRYGRGHRVEDSNLVLGGDEFVINGRTTSRHRNFIEQLNAGHYDNIDLAASMNNGFRKRDATIQQRSSKRNQQMLNSAMSHAMQQHSGQLIKYMAKQGQYYSYSPGDTIVHVTPTQIIKKKA